MKNLTLISFIFLLLSCSDDPITPAPQIGQSGYLSCTMNGALWQGQTFNNSVFNGVHPSQGIEGSKLEISTIGPDGVNLLFSVSDTNRATGEFWVDTGVYHSDSLNKVVLVMMIENYNTPPHTVTYGMPGYARVEVTSCNSITQTASGNFDFEIYDLMDSTLVYSCTNGQFTNCQYAFKDF